jgi:hypothetical protein
MTKILISAGVGLVLFTVAVVVGYRTLTRTIQGRLLAVLGPHATVQSVEVGFRDVTVKNLRIRGKGGTDPLSVERIVVTPSLRSLFTGQIRLSDVELDRVATVVHLRPRGRVELPLPVPAPDQPAGVKGQPTQVAISQVRLTNAQIDLVDHTVPGPPVRLRLDEAQASVGDVAVPLASGRSPLEFEAKIRGKKVEGRVHLSGWVDPLTEDASVKATLRSIDMTLLSPYLLKVHEAKVDRGQLNMDLDFQVRKRRINAPGKASFIDLQLSSAPGAVNSFMGLPRQGVLNLLKSKEGKIDIAFRVEGDLDDPQFTLQRSFITAMTMGMAEQLGVSIKGVGSGVVGLGKRGAETVGGAAEQLGGSLKRLFEKRK